eukprot:gene24106-2944_t
MAAAAAAPPEHRLADLALADAAALLRARRVSASALTAACLRRREGWVRAFVTVFREEAVVEAAAADAAIAARGIPVAVKDIID